MQDRLTWVVPKPSRKALWRRRKQALRLQEAGPSAPRQISPGMAGKCFKCLRNGHYSHCTNDQVCIRYGEEGHGSGGCKRPRCPDSDDELPRQALEAVVRRVQGAARRSAGGQPSGRGQGAPAAGQPGAPGRRSPAAREGLPGPPAGARGDRLPTVLVEMPAAWPALEQWGAGSSVVTAEPPCIIRRTSRMEEMEGRLRWSLVAYLGGARPRVSREKVEEELISMAGVPRGEFSVHGFQPEDFLIVFRSPDHMRALAARPSLEQGQFTLFFRSMLGTSCLVLAVAPEAASREELGMFRVDGWAVDPEGIPPLRELWVPEPAAGIPYPAPVSRNKEMGLMKYRVLIHIVKIEEFCFLEDPGFGPSGGSPGSDRDGLPEEDSSGHNGEGFWTSRTRFWSSGEPDRRGPFADGGEMGDNHGNGRQRYARCGVQEQPSDWRLPGMDGSIVLMGQDEVVDGARKGKKLVVYGHRQEVCPADTAALAKPVDCSLVRVPSDLVETNIEARATNQAGPGVVSAGPATAVGERSKVDHSSDRRLHNVAVPVSSGDSVASSRTVLADRSLQLGWQVEDKEIAAQLEQEFFLISLTGSCDSLERGTAQKDFTGTTGGFWRNFSRPGVFSNLAVGCCILKKLAPPLLWEIEAAAVLQDLESCTPRRIPRASGPLGAVAPAGRKPKKANTAETVLLKALGIQRPSLEVDELALQEFRGLFDSPMREPHLRVMAAIFGKTLPIGGLQGHLGGIIVQ
ncbi:unnamed protein product [Alopecurus aequalis]